HGWKGRILVFSPLLAAQLPEAADAGLTPCFSGVDLVRRWAQEGRQRGSSLPFHLEVDTGMGRAGLPAPAAARWAPEVVAAAGEGARWAGVYTHYHSADEPDLAATDRQRAAFMSAVAAIPASMRGQLVIHSCNSAAAMRRGGFEDDLVRPGIFLYGGGVGAEIRPQPVASVRARLVLTKEVPPGATVGYGATYRAEEGERWGTLSIGYGDGLP